MQDPCAVAVLERYQLLLPERDPVTQERVSVWEHRLQSLRTFPLGTPYADVIAHITELAQELRALPGVSGVDLAVDATGGGIPVVEYLRAARPECRINAVTITGGGVPTSTGSSYSIPKRDLIARLQLMLEQDALRIGDHLPALGELRQQMRDFRLSYSRTGHDQYSARSGTHDDLILALCLAAWKSWKPPVW